MLFDPEDGGIVFQRNISGLLLDTVIFGIVIVTQKMLLWLKAMKRVKGIQ